MLPSALPPCCTGLPPSLGNVCGGGDGEAGVEAPGVEGLEGSRSRSPWLCPLALTLLLMLGAVSALCQGNPQERGAGEKAALSPSQLWPPEVLPAGVHV